MDDDSRDKFYAPGGDDWGDDEQEYELEPPDADVIAAEKRRAHDEIVASTLAIDVDEIYRELEGRTDLAIGQAATDSFRFQFRVKHLLILTAVVAVMLTIVKMKFMAAVFAFLLLVGAGGALAYVEFHQQRRWVAAQRRFAEKYERRRQFFEHRMRAPGGVGPEPATIYDDLSFNGTPTDIASAGEVGHTRKPFRFQFSLWQLLAAMTCAALIFGLINIVGGPQNAATLLGFAALAGLLIHALGADPPEIVVFGWWLMLAMYVILSAGIAISSTF